MAWSFRKSAKNPGESRGFTLVELLVVIVVIGVLAAVAIPVFLSQSDKASDASLKSDLANAAKLLQVAEANGETLPSQITAGQVVDLGSAGTFTSNQTLTVTGTGESLCVQGTSDSGTTFSADLDNGIRDYDCAGIQTGALVTDGLILHLDAANPTSYSGSGDTWTDLSGQTGNVSLTTGGGFSAADGGAMVFDGIDDYLDSGFGDGLDPSQTSFSFGMWLKPDSTSSAMMYLAPSSHGSTQRAYFGVHGWWNMGIYDDNWGDGRVTASTSWTFLSGVFDSSTNTARLYVNGSYSHSKTYEPYQLRSNFQIGRGGNMYSPDFFFDGSVGNVLFYDRALSETEIQRNFDATRERYSL